MREIIIPSKCAEIVCQCAQRGLCKSMFILSVVEFGTRSLPPGTDLGLSFLGDFVGDLRLLRLRDLLGFS